MNVKAMINSFGLKCKKHSPEILMVAGIATMATGAFVAAKKSQKHAENKYLRDTHLEMITNKSKSVEDEEGNVTAITLTEDEAKKEVKKEIRRYVVEEIKIWSLPVALEVSGSALIFASNHIMRKRVAGLSAAFTTVSTAFDQYRERVRERYGDEVDQSILMGEKQVTIETTDEKGKTKKETITVADPDISSIGRYFVKGNDNWSNSESFVNDFFSLQQSYLTDLLRARGFVLLNDIYDCLGFQKDTEAGIVVGKVYDRNSDDNYIQITWKKTLIPDEFGNYEDAYYVDFPGLDIIYGKGAGHRSLV